MARFAPYNRAIGIYSGANLAKLAEPHFDVLIYAFV
jgi:hypothetical protein